MKYNISTIISNCETLADIQRILTLVKHVDNIEFSEELSSEEIEKKVIGRIRLSRAMLEEFSSKLTGITNSWHDFCLSLGGSSSTTDEFFNPLLGEDHANLYLYIGTKKMIFEDDLQMMNHQMTNYHSSIVNWYRQFPFLKEELEFDIEIFKISDEVGICFNIFGCFDILKFIALTH